MKLSLSEHLEPVAIGELGTTEEVVISASTAVSLKRIADALDRLSPPHGSPGEDFLQRLSFTLQDSAHYWQRTTGR